MILTNLFLLQYDIDKLNLLQFNIDKLVFSIIIKNFIPILHELIHHFAVKVSANIY